jgi:nucleotide-binding universal stress UspA family protein
MYKHILVSTDGSDLARKGLEQGLALAKSLGARVTIVTVTERLPIYAGFDGGLTALAYSDYTASQRAGAEQVLGAAKEAAAGSGVVVEAVLIENALPAEAIIATAKARGCDLIAMASHGRRGLGRLVLGSVTVEVLTHSDVPVLVVR